MKITVVNGSETLIFLSGQLDTLSSTDFEKEVINALAGPADRIVIDGKELTYISSAGLRLLLTLQKGMKSKGGSLSLRNIRMEIMEIFNITGFSSILSFD